MFIQVDLTTRNGRKDYSSVRLLVDDIVTLGTEYIVEIPGGNNGWLDFITVTLV